MKLTPPQLKTLKSLPTYRKKKLFFSWKKIIAENSVDGTITSEILMKHSYFFRISITRFVKKSAEVLRKEIELTTSHFTHSKVMRLIVVHQLWSLAEVNSPFPSLTIFHRLLAKTLENENEKKSLEKIDTIIAEFGNQGTLAIKNDGKVKRLVKREQIWMKKVKQWRSQHVDHPNYSMDHPEEQKFRHRKEAINDRIQQLRMYRKTYDKMLETIAVRRCQV